MCSRWSVINLVAIFIAILVVAFPFQYKTIVLMVIAIVRTIVDSLALLGLLLSLWFKLTAEISPSVIRMSIQGWVTVMFLLREKAGGKLSSKLFVKVRQMLEVVDLEHFVPDGFLL